MKNIDIMATIRKNVLAVIFLAVGAALVIMGLATAAPSVSLNSQTLKQSQYIAAVISKSVYISIGALICCNSALKLELVKKNEA